MRILDTSTAELSASELEDLYAFPAALSRPWICVNLVSSVDGAVSLDGHSSALSDVADRRIFLLGRALSDVVLVGAGTARAEDYRGARTPSRVAKLRERLGLSAAPPIAVVSASCAIDPDSRLLTDTAVAPIVFTTGDAPSHRRTALRSAGAEVIEAGQHTVSLPQVVAVLTDLRLLRVCCEGGPGLFGSLVDDDLLDELRLTLAPMLLAGDARRIAHSPAQVVPRGLRLDSVLRQDNTLMLRYLRAR